MKRLQVFQKAKKNRVQKNLQYRDSSNIVLISKICEKKKKKYVFGNYYMSKQKICVKQQNFTK